MDIKFGTIPLIVLTFQAYQLVRKFTSDYKSFNNKLRSVLRDIYVSSEMFKDAVDKLLSEVVEEDKREIMLEDLDSDHWKQPDLNDQLECLLGGSLGTVVDSIHRTQGTLEEIRDVLLLLSGTKICPPKKGFLFGRATKVATVATTTLKTDPLKLQFHNIQIQSTKEKLLFLVKDHRGELKQLRDDLRSQNSEFLAFLNLSLDKIANSRRLKPQTTHQVPPAAHEVESSACHIVRACSHWREAQTASERLYQIISQAVVCDCHFTHLCLDRQTKKTPIAARLSGGSKQPATLDLNFSFQLTVKLNDNKNHYTQPVHLAFTSCNFKDSDSIPRWNTPIQMICKELVSSNEGFESYFRDNTVSSTSGFLLRRTSCSNKTAETLNRAPLLSLDDILASRHTELELLDRLLIAVNLAYSVVHLYSSPWVRSWSTQTIHCFKNHESSELGLWTPYLSITPDNGGFGARNREIYSLGLILLQLGGRQRLEASYAEKEEYVLAAALRNVCKEMGYEYMNFVKNCLDSWSGQSINLMEDRNLNPFLSHVGVLEELVDIFRSN